MSNATAPGLRRAPYRRRRIIWSFILLTTAFLVYLGIYSETPFASLSTYLKAIGLSSSSSRARLISDAKNNELVEAGRPRVQEIHGLLHFVTAYPDRRLDEEDGEIAVAGLGNVQVNGREPVDLRVYSPYGDDDWKKHVKTLKQQSPLVVFSKSYCPYSKRAKALLQSHNLSPAPTVIELDLRSDGAIIQAILGRLTGRTTVPNIILQGKSIGGSDDIQHLSENGELVKLLRKGGLTAGGL